MSIANPAPRSTSCWTAWMFELRGARSTTQPGSRHSGCRRNSHGCPTTVRPNPRTPRRIPKEDFRALPSRDCPDAGGDPTIRKVSRRDAGARRPIPILFFVFTPASRRETSGKEGARPKLRSTQSIRAFHGRKTEVEPRSDRSLGWYRFPSCKSDRQNRRGFVLGRRNSVGFNHEKHEPHEMRKFEKNHRLRG